MTIFWLLISDYQENRENSNVYGVWNMENGRAENLSVFCLVARHRHRHREQSTQSCKSCHVFHNNDYLVTCDNDNKNDNDKRQETTANNQKPTDNRRTQKTKYLIQLWVFLFSHYIISETSCGFYCNVLPSRFHFTFFFFLLSMDCFFFKSKVQR